MEPAGNICLACTTNMIETSFDNQLDGIAEMSGIGPIDEMNPNMAVEQPEMSDLHSDQIQQLEGMNDMSQFMQVEYANDTMDADQIQTEMNQDNKQHQNEKNGNDEQKTQTDEVLQLELPQHKVQNYSLDSFAAVEKPFTPTPSFQPIPSIGTVGQEVEQSAPKLVLRRKSRRFENNHSGSFELVTRIVDEQPNRVSNNSSIELVSIGNQRPPVTIRSTPNSIVTRSSMGSNRFPFSPRIILHRTNNIQEYQRSVAKRRTPKTTSKRKQSKVRFASSDGTIIST